MTQSNTDRQLLFSANLNAIERFAKWLGIRLPKKPDESNAAYKARLINRIQRFENKGV